MSRSVRLLVPVVALAAGAAIVAVPGGCNRPAESGSTSVRGAVTFQGQPLRSGLVVFSPDADRGGSGKPIRGDLDREGRYRLSQADLPSIPPGWYRVAILAVPAPGSVVQGAAFPAKLARPDMSGLAREVKPNQENVFDFAIEVLP
ncbi:MAG TPA: hypothetical protein VLM40_03200 [Gemmata sp.]|nr:hypothetical protein [Gemmata sp.]